VVDGNVSAARRVCEPWERGDFTHIDWAAPDIEFATRDFPDPVEVRGLAALGPAWGGFLGAWDDFRVFAEEYVDLGEAVLVLTRFGGTAKQSGVAADGMPGACVLTFRDGKVGRLELYNNRERALAEARTR
jgi:hypothetical protein